MKFGEKVWVSLKAMLWPLMLPSPAPKRRPGVAVLEGRRLEAVGLVVAVADEEPVVVGQAVVQLDVELVVLARHVRVDEVVVDRLAGGGVAGPLRVRLGIELRHDVRGGGIPPALRDDVARERRAGTERVVDDAGQLGEVPLAHAHRGHGREVGLGRGQPQALVVREDERLVLDDRAADRAAELVLREVALRPSRAVVEPVVGVEGIVAQELEDAAVELVRPRLDLEADDAAQRLAELGRVGARLELELLESVRAREDDHGLEPGLVVVDPVEHVVVVARALAVRGEPRRRTPGQAARAVDVPSGDAAQDAGHRAGEAHEVAAVEGQGLDLLLDDGGAEIGRRGLQERRLGLDLDDLGHGAELERNVDAHLLVDADEHVRLRHLLEARDLGA